MPSALLAGDLARGATTQFRVRPDDVVVMLPGSQDRSGVRQRGEQLVAEALVTQTAVQRFRERVLRRFARRDVIPIDLPFL